MNFDGMLVFESMLNRRLRRQFDHGLDERMTAWFEGLHFNCNNIIKMGGNFSNFEEKSILTFVNQEYEKYKSGKTKGYLVLSEILSVTLPEDYIFNFYHLGNLYCMDWNKDGRFSLDDIQKFA